MKRHSFWDLLGNLFLVAITGGLWLIVLLVRKLID